MVADSPEPPAGKPRDRPHELVGHQRVDDLLRALPADDEQLVTALEAVLGMACAACPSCVAVSLTLDHQGQPVTVTATLHTSHPPASSLTVPLPRLSLFGPARQPALLVVFATDAVALGRSAAEITALLEIDPRQITLSSDDAVPEPGTAGLMLAGQLADRAVVDRALGSLLEQGWPLADGREQLQRKADDAGTSLVQAATTILAELAGPPTQHHA